MVLTCIIGGIGTVTGPLLGAVVLVLLSEWLRASLAQAHLLVYGVLVIAVILLMPDGFVGFIAQRLRRKRRSDEALLEVRNVSRYFGGVKANQDVSFSVSRASCRLIGPNGGEDHAVQLHHRVLPSVEGGDPLRRPAHQRFPPDKVCQAGDGADLAESPAAGEA